jgi:glycosyltransferase involved in cell wall biosynthesis
MSIDSELQPAIAPAPPAVHSPTISVVVPCYNEEPGLAAFLDRLAEVMRRTGLAHEILVIDDGSSDGTSGAAASAGARVIRHPDNLGYGASLLTGIEAARHDWVAMIDGDGQFAPEEMLKLLVHLPRADMVVGRRSGVSLWRGPAWSVLRWSQLRLASFVAGRGVPDPNSGLRLVRRQALRESLRVICNGFSFSTTLTLSFLVDEREVVFVPVECALGRVSSKMRIGRDILVSLRMMLLVLLRFKPFKLALTLVALALAAVALLGGFDVRNLRALVR